ncbi:MAG: rsfS [Hyphomicrobiales bacterium]|nr:rsfS [Hyphomicrobiales bacterium]
MNSARIPPTLVKCRALRDQEENKALITTVQSGADQSLPHPVRVQAEPDTGQLVRTILNSLDDAKAEEVLSIDLHGKTSLADAMIIATGRSSTHVGAIADRVIKGCKEAGYSTPRVEGMPHCDWVLVDAGDVIVHLFRPEVRQFYNLEKMWGGDRPAEHMAERRAV